MIFDPLYIVLLLPGLILAGWASFKVRAAFNKYSRVPAVSGNTGAQTARIILDRNGLNDVPIEAVAGSLSDHYDPSSRTLRLSPEVYGSRSVAAQGIAAHEAGHAIQHKERYAALQLRSALVPLANLGSNFAWILITFGIILASAGSALGLGMAKFGVLVFGAAVLFTIVTLPVEFNASSRAKVQLAQNGLVAANEMDGVSAVLSAAAMTYLAAAVTAVLQLLYWLLRLGLLGGRDE